MSKVFRIFAHFCVQRQRTTTIMTKQDMLNLIGQPEGMTLEYKSAKSGLPESLWETYSSFANSNGGVIILGMKEKNGRTIPDNLTHDQILTYKKRLWDCVHNKDVASLCLLSKTDVEDAEIDGSWLLFINVPRARFDQRPIYLTHNPFGHTFIRNHEGDYRCTDEEVHLMFADAESQNHSFDNVILTGFTMDDVDIPTLHSFRNRFNIHNVNHPWSSLDDMEFLKKIKAYRVDRKAGEEGFTRAGILMFGKTDAITDPSCAPWFFPDLQEWHILDRGERWSDRICPDGYWEANLYQFFNRAYAKLVQQLPIPFKLDGVQRVDETTAHKSIREALVNTLVHTNYLINGSTLIKILPDKILMRNPGRMLVSVDEYYAGSHSVCRNPYLQNMFRFIGLGEKAGSGADIIAKGWEDNHWARPTITEKLYQPQYTELVLDLIKPEKSSVKSSGSSSENTHNVADSIIEKLGRKLGKKLGKNRLAILELIVKNPNITYVQIAETLSISTTTVEKRVAEMSGVVIQHTGPKKGGHWEIIDNGAK